MAAARPLYKDPFTGKVFDIAKRSHDCWIPTGLFNPKTQFLSEEKAISALCLRRNGKPKQKPSYRCPYSGKKFTIEQHPRTGAWIAHGLTPVFRPYRSLEAAEYALSTRSGQKPSIPEHPPKVTVIGIKEPPPQSPIDDNDLGDLTQEFIETIAEN